jgi:hypothetical protein
MAFYRVQNVLDRGKGRQVHPGTLTRLAWLSDENRQRLVDCGAVTVASPPPLRILPGWKVRAGKLRKHGIITAVHFLEADNEKLNDILKPAREAVIDKWKEELEKQLSAPPQKG